LHERMEGNSWKRGWERYVGEMLGLKGFKRGWEGIVERGWLVLKGQKREWEEIIRRENGRAMVRREDRKVIRGEIDVREDERE
jgi:hypothetical protein